MTWVPPPTALVRLLISFTIVYSKALLCEQCMIQEPGNADDAWSVLLQAGVGGFKPALPCMSTVHMEHGSLSVRAHPQFRDGLKQCLHGLA